MQDENKGRDRLIFGFQEEWHDFEQRNALFLNRFPRIVQPLTTAFNRDAQLSEPIDKFVLMYGRVCVEDFFEILLCCGNGNGQAAQKLLRGLYERAVTLRYLHEHPSEIENFLDFHLVSQRKLMIACKETMGEEVFSSDMTSDIEMRYLEVKNKFLVTDCERCGTKRINHTWGKLDFVAMAKATVLGQLIVPGYYIPLRQAHATVASALSRVEMNERQGISFLHSPQRREADNALRVSHNIFLDVLRVQAEHFTLPGLNEQNDFCLHDFLDISRNGIAAS